MDLLIHRTRLVGRTSLGDPVDVRMRGGRVTEIGALTPVDGERVLDAAGRSLMPGLWDKHVHFGQWVALQGRLDLAGTATAAEALERVDAHIRALPDDGLVVTSWGHRASVWPDAPLVADLDAVSHGRAVVLISGDGHNGWLNSAALAGLGLPPHERALEEAEWFAVFPRLGELGRDAALTDEAEAAAITAAHALGVVGIVDLEFGGNLDAWRRREAAGAPPLRVRSGVYPDQLEATIAAGLRTGDAITPLVTMGPLKIISDGALGTLTAHCCEPYLDLPARVAHPCGVQSVPADELERLLGRATEHGLDIALHAIGDAAVGIALDAFAATGARGSVEHAQLMRFADLQRMAELGVVASVQPAHLLDDAPVMDRVWADRTERTFALRSMLEAGVELAFGSDAPVSALDPWLEIDAAVLREPFGHEAAGPWHGEQALDRSDALWASTDGRGPIEVGDVADLILLEGNPLEVNPRVVTTLINGDIVYEA